MGGPPSLDNWALFNMTLLAGVDEVGRGPLAGPVVTAAVILSPDDPYLGKYRDSKKVAEKKRLKLYHHIRRHAVAYSVTMASIEEIDELNILHATMLSMRRSVEGLSVAPSRVLVDGNRIPDLTVPAEAIVGGDDSVQEIAAASIIAKVVRDRLMQRLDYLFPGYDLSKHKGYGTKVHMDALREIGPSPVHRKSFAPIARLL
ncbi:RNase HII [Mariprofundus ferrinatatus]|uniref:Ribonuclease HII n=1 Tax=Mariprofundus ferrinatatus TaxID=1921087 RepID=A0A2K8LCA0_9PROT|nr:ribonuclease HII [Mariprofundus ferrinatatus]ATX82524.1 RNase HII [Mariprofundus ferrinatatus]